MEVEKFYYDNKIVRKFIVATLLWGVVGMSVGLILAFMFLFPNMTEGISWLSFGRLRPLHTNAVIFAFVGNAIFAGVYYSTQRLLKARMWSNFLSKLNFWGWQAIIVGAAITLPLGYTTSKEYAFELT
jgi:cytochrome c oxidase cbb3-type subunit I/II